MITLPNGQQLSCIPLEHFERVTLYKMLAFKHKFRWYTENMEDACETDDYELVVEMCGNDTIYSPEMYKQFVEAVELGTITELCSYFDVINEICSFLQDNPDGTRIFRCCPPALLDNLVELVRRDSTVYIAGCMNRLLAKIAMNEWKRTK